MKPTVRLVLLVLGMLCFLLAAWGVQAPRGGNLISAGLFFITFAMLFT